MLLISIARNTLETANAVPGRFRTILIRAAAGRAATGL
jgi:hypothetical protein